MIYIINTGTSSNKGDGDTLRSAFNKINQNFQYLSTFTGANLTAVNGNISPSATNTFTLGTATTVWKSLYLGPSGVSINGNILTVNQAGDLTLNGVVVGTSTGTNLTFGPIIANTPAEIIDQSRAINFGTITNPGSLAYSAGTII